MKTNDRIAQLFSQTGASIKSLAKIALQSRKCRITKHPESDGDTIVILANGPSLRQTMADHIDKLRYATTLAVNFAANTDVFFELRPRYYVLADPHFFKSDEPNVQSLWQKLRDATWPITLYVPASYLKHTHRLAPNLNIQTYNAVGVEGFRFLRHAIFRSGLGMPRPRNVLIPSIMIAIKAGFRKIYLTGADHSWLQTLSVGDDNAVLSIQPHFYADEKRELARSASEYRGYHLHQVLENFSIAFRGYHNIADYASTKSVMIYNSTPGSFIDAFPRKELP